MENKEVRVLYADDLAGSLENFRINFKQYYTVFTAASATEAREILAKEEIHVLISDQKMPGTPGTQLLEESFKQYPQPIRILLAAYANAEAIMDAFQRGLIYKYAFKPYKPEELKTMIDRAYEIYQLKRVKEHLYKEWIRTEEAIFLLKMKNKVNLK